MANITSIKIPELSELSQEEFTGAEYLVLDTGTATKKMQVSDFNRASTETATAKANEATQSAQSAAQSALSAQNAAHAAQDAIANATSQIAQSVIDVQTAKSNAESSANTARNLVNSDYALTARSYATGDAEDALGHEYREGQSTDNAKYYSKQCADHDSAAAISESNAKASENNAKASEIAAAESAQSAARSAQQALENATGANVFDGSDAGLVPSTNISNGFLNANGQWQEKSWMNNHSFANRIINGNTTPSALSKGALFMRRRESDGEWRLCRAKTAIKADAELSFGNYEETSFQELLSEMQTSFQNGVDTIYNACSTYMEDSYKPSQSTPSAIATAVQSQMQTTVEEYIAFFLPTLGTAKSATFYVPVQRLQSLHIDYCNRELKVNDVIVSSGHTIREFKMQDPDYHDYYAVCKIEIYQNPNDSYMDAPTFKATATYSMYKTDLPIFDATQEENPY